jgi:hypothetical protein
MNTVPVFSTALTNVTVQLMKSVNYPFPSIIDPDYGATTSFLSVKNNATNTLPSFINFTSTSLIISPNLMS